MLKTSEAFHCEHFLSPYHADGKSFIHIAMLYTGNSAQGPSFGCEDYFSPSSPHGESIVHYATQYINRARTRLSEVFVRTPLGKLDRYQHEEFVSGWR